LRIVLILCLSAIVLLQGCIFVPFIESVKEIGATASHRQQLLPKSLKDFHEAIYWKDMTRASSFVAQDATEKDSIVKTNQNVERLVDIKVEQVKYTEDAFEADVTVIIRAYNNKTLVISERRESEAWLYTISNGWKILSRGAASVTS
jgi:hypothetical protein